MFSCFGINLIVIHVTGTEQMLIIHFHMQLILILPLNHHILINSKLLVLIKLLPMRPLLEIVVLQRPAPCLEAGIANLSLGGADFQGRTLVDIGVGTGATALVVFVGFAVEVAAWRLLVIGYG